MRGKHAGWLSVTPPLPPSVYLRRRRHPLPFPLEETTHRIFARARHGLYRGLQALQFRDGDEVLTPAYHHGSEIETLRRAGLRCRFYDCDEKLAPQEAELTGLVGPQTRALYLIHYFGIPQNAHYWRSWCDQRGLMLLEDAAQSWLATCDSGPVGSHGELAIYCLHKSFGLPDGGALVAKSPPSSPSVDRGVEVHRLLVRHGEWLAQRTPLARRLREPERFAHWGAETPDRAFSLGDPELAPATATTFLLPRIADVSAAEKRRRNHERLRLALAEHAPPAFRSIPSGSAPYVFLVAAPRKRELLDRLAASGIIGGSLWETPHPSVDVASFPNASGIRSAFVGLPVHQELRTADVDRIVRAFSAAVRS